MEFPQPNEMLAAAQAYVTQGWSVNPIQPRDKKPLIPWEEFQSRIATAEELGKWFKKGQNNVGIVTGNLSKLVVIDVDVDSIKSLDGNMALDELQKKYGFIPETVEVKTPRGGRHLYFQYPMGFDVRNSVGEIGEGLDVRAQGGYVCAPPSTHPNGKQYEYVEGRSPGEIALAELPLWLLKLMLAQKPTTVSSPGTNGNGTITEGRRNAHFTSLAGAMRRKGCDQTAIEAALLAENLTKCKNPLPEGEIKNIAASICRYEPSEVNSISAAGLLCAGDIRPEPVAWLWKDWLAREVLHILAGAPGTGKTTVALAVAATISVGGRWPDGSRADEGDVLIWSGEDMIAKTLVPRLLAMGADLKRVHFVKTACGEGNQRRPFDPATDLPQLQAAIQNNGLKPQLLIVDSIVSVVRGDSHKNSETRRSLQPLVDLAEAEGCAVLGISHFSKGTAGREVTERVTGSLAFGAVARLVWATAKRSEEQGGRVLVRAKSNLGPEDGGYSYDLNQTELAEHPGVAVSCLLWGAAIEGTARDLLAEVEATNEDGAERTERDAARQWLEGFLKDGAQPSIEVRRQSGEAGFSWATIRRAKNEIRVEANKTGVQGGWEWQLSPRCSPKSQDAHHSGVSSLGDFEHLGSPASGTEDVLLIFEEDENNVA